MRGACQPERATEFVTYLADDRQAAIDRAIVDGYTRIPPTEDFGGEWAARTLIAAEPWPS
jgi:hypothetical protein